MPDRPLPRLLYVGDVPVEASYHGSALIYRLLQRYPADRLRIIETNLFRPGTDRRLPDVHHATLSIGWPRLLQTRMHDWYGRWLLTRARSRTPKLRALLAGFLPDSVLTVAHGYSWLTAAQYAEDSRVPLHVIVHDDWPRLAAAQPLVEREFARVYRQAASRLCVSPFMAEEYERRYGAAGTVLMPARAPDARTFTGLPERLQQDMGGPVIAFAGTINSPGYATLLSDLAAQLARHQGTLRIYGPLTQMQAAASGLTAANIRLEGLLPSSQLLVRLRAEADVLFVPMSFADADRSNMRMSFPSKLTDYTAAGLPLLICGPADSSAVRWALANPGVAEVVTSNDSAAIGRAVDRLCRDRDLRVRLGRTAQAVGNRDFSADTAEAILHAALVA
jgi:glycosyltransferase involved in cell wall biosynthesis